MCAFIAFRYPRLISCNLLFTNGSDLHQTVESIFIKTENSLLVVKVLNGRKVDELDKAIVVAAKDPAYYQLDETELEKRKRWTGMARGQVKSLQKELEIDTQTSNLISPNMNGKQKELVQLTDGHAHLKYKSSTYVSQDNDFISSESDRQLLLIKKQDEELDELSASVQRIGGVGLTIHEELMGQDKILEDLNVEMETTGNRLDFIQKKVAMVMKKVSAKAQIMMIAFLVVLFIILFVLVFFT